MAMQSVSKSSASKKPLPASLQSHPLVWRASDAARRQQAQQQHTRYLSTGHALLDAHLGGHGLPAYGLSEVLSERWGWAEMRLLKQILQQAAQTPRWLVWVQPPWQPYAPALQSWGIASDQILIIQAETHQQQLWAMEQCLASDACSLVLGWPARINPTQIRRLHLAAERGHCCALLMRADHAQGQPSPAPIRLQLDALQQQLLVRVLKSPGRWGSDWLPLQPPQQTQQKPSQPSELSQSSQSSQSTSQSPTLISAWRSAQTDAHAN